MKAMFLALALINAPAADQELMLADLIDADPVLAVDVLDSVDELLQSDGKCLPWHRGFVVNVDIVSVDELLQSDGKCLPWHRGFVVNVEIVSVDELLQSDGKCLPWHRGFVVNAEIVHDAGGKSIVLDDTTVGVTGGHQDKAWSPTVR